MPTGLPDYTAPVKLQAWDGSALRDVRVDANGQLYMLVQGYTGTTYIPILVDAAGNLVAVMKGDYEGTLKTITLDSAGRMLAKVVDDVDAWGKVVVKGNAEAAAMLGSIKTFDRRGDVLWMEGFEHGLSRWVVTAVGADSKAYVSPTVTRSQGLACRLDAGSATGNYIEIRRGYPYLSDAKLGMEYSWTLLGGEQHITLATYVWDGTNYTEYAIRYDPVADKLLYLDSAGAWVDFATAIKLESIYQGFNLWKMVVDTSTRKYIRALVNASSYDLSGIAAYAAANTTGPYAAAVIALYNLTAAAIATDYVDDVIITHQEP